MEPRWIDPDRNQHRRYVFNSQDRLYCANKECGSYREATLKERIREERIEKFPERVQDFIDDVMLVCYSDEEFLAPEEWDSLWQQLLDVEQRATAIHERDIRPPIEDSDEAQFGFELGHTIGLLRRESSPTEPLIWGLIQGILATGWESTEAQTKTIESIITQFENRIAKRCQRSKAELGEQGRMDDLSDDIESRLNVHLHSYDIEGTASEIGIIERFVGRIIRSGRGYDLSEDIKSFVEQHDLYAVDYLRKQLERDSKIVANKSKQGVEVCRLLQYMHRESRVDHSIESNNDNTRPDPPKYVIKPVHKDEFPFSSKKSHMLVNALKQLSNTADGGLNPSQPVVEQVESGWQLTAYGDILCHTVFEEKDSTWVYDYSTDQNDLEAQYKQLIQDCITPK